MVRIRKNHFYKHIIKHNDISSKYHNPVFIKEFLRLFLMLVTVLYITGYELKLLHTHILIQDMIQKSINYDAFREMKINAATLRKADDRVKHLCLKYPRLKSLTYFDDIGYLTYSMMAKNYNLLKYSPVDEITFLRGINKVAITPGFQELYGYYRAIITDLEYFPVPNVDAADVYYGDTWYEPRSYGGKRNHEGTDLMASNNIRGFFPVISISDGVIEKMGWLEQGGYRIGVRSKAGGYFYYAHLYSYAPELKEGDSVLAGQLLGFMGDSGYGSEGTIGQFDVHLHLGIYVNHDFGEMSINPYWILKILENHRIKYSF